MKKLKLNLDEIKVESFEIGSFLQKEKGTIRGNSEETIVINGCTQQPCSGLLTCQLDCTAHGVCPPPSADNTLCILSCLYECG